MNAPLFLRILCLSGVLISGLLYLQVRKQKLSLDENLNISRAALQDQLSHSAKLKSRTLQAEETSQQMEALAREEGAKATGFKQQFDHLTQRAEAAESAQKRGEEERKQLLARYHNLQRENNSLQASVPPNHWREQLTEMQSRILELEAENASLRRSLSHFDRGIASSTSAPHEIIDPPKSHAIGEVVRFGPDGSFAIIN